MDKPQRTITVLGSEVDQLETEPSARLIRLLMDDFSRQIEAARIEQRQARESALAKWRDTLPYVKDAGPEQAPAIVQAYRETVIPVRLLLDLISPDRDVRTKARIKIENEGGFLHDEPPALEPYMGSRGLTKYLRGDRGELNGFYTVACDTDDVKKMSRADLGYEDGVVYDEDNLPRKLQNGYIEWTNRGKAAEMLNSLHTVAFPGDLVILPRKLGRNVGWGKGLKVGTYEDLEHRFPEKETTVTRIFEITKVNGQPLEDTVPNVWSRHMNITNLRAAHIGTKTERFTRKDEAEGLSVDLEVNWWLLRSRVRGLLEQAYQS